MKKILVLNKKEGETPLEAIQSFRKKNSKYINEKMTYAGRLDPMASGVLLVLAGDEVKNKEKYLAFPKEYEFEVLFGVSTDSYDVLGKVIWLKKTGKSIKELEQQIEGELKHFKGRFIQEYPLYSSRPVNGKPLFKYGREGVLVKIPEKVVYVKSLKFLKLRQVKSSDLFKNIERRIKKVTGDFRQPEIMRTWEKNLKKEKSNFQIAKFKITCGSGTYVRGIAHSLGQKMNIPAVAFSIKRTKVGKFAKMS